MADVPFTTAMKGPLFAVLLYLSSFFGVLVCGGGLLPVFLYSPSRYRQLYDYCIGSWMTYCAGLLEYLLWIRPVISGDAVRADEGCLLLMNHRTRLDWLYLWQLLVRQAGVRTEKIILKSPLKKIPGAGWAMQVGAFLFLSRRWENDKRYLATMVDYFSGLPLKAQVLIFPEGTNLTKVTQARSDEFAAKNDLPALQYLLHPRVTGFTYLTQHMRNNGQISAVYDITIAYPYNFPVTEPELLGGNFPREVHFHVKRYDIAELPANEEGLQEWCREVWQQKEKRLGAFYKHKSFTVHTPDHNDGDNNNESRPSSSSSPPSSSPSSSSSSSSSSFLHLFLRLQEWCREVWQQKEKRLGAFYKHKSFTVHTPDHNDGDNNNESRSPTTPSPPPPSSARVLLLSTIFLWSVFMVGAILALYWWSWARWLVLGQCAFFTYMTLFRGGFELYQAETFLRQQQQQRPQQQQQHSNVQAGTSTGTKED